MGVAARCGAILFITVLFADAGRVSCQWFDMELDEDFADMQEDLIENESPNGAADSHNGRGFEGNNWRTAAREEAQGMAEEMEGVWRSLNATRIGNTTDICPAFAIRSSGSSIILEIRKDVCRIHIDWYPREVPYLLRREFWWGTFSFNDLRTIYEPLVSFVDLR